MSPSKRGSAPGVKKDLDRVDHVQQCLQCHTGGSVLGVVRRPPELPTGRFAPAVEGFPYGTLDATCFFVWVARRWGRDQERPRFISLWGGLGTATPSYRRLGFPIYWTSRTGLPIGEDQCASGAEKGFPNLLLIRASCCCVR